MHNPFDPGFYTEDDLNKMGFGHVGNNVRIAKNCTIIGLGNISIGNNVRIDAYTSIFAPDSGFLRLGSYVHIAAYSLLSAGSGILIEDFCGLSRGVSIFSRTDDYSGSFLTNPLVPKEYTGGTYGTVTLKRHSILGAHSVVLPKITVGEGVSVGALSLVTKNLDDWGIYFGIPAKRLKNRSRKLLGFEKQLLPEQGHKQE